MSQKSLTYNITKTQSQYFSDEQKEFIKQTFKSQTKSAKIQMSRLKRIL